MQYHLRITIGSLGRAKCCPGLQEELCQRREQISGAGALSESRWTGRYHVGSSAQGEEVEWSVDSLNPQKSGIQNMGLLLFNVTYFLYAFR